jgi:iron complex transport system substrate-binding protein
VSLAPNITEILYALGLGKQIVGVTRYCDYPPDALAKEKVGGLIDPDLERIRALNPDLIVAFRGNPLPVIQRMRSLNLPVFVLEMGQTVESVLPFLERIGRVTRREKEAAALVQDLRTRYDALETALRCDTSKPRLFLSLNGLGLWTCGRESYLTDMADKAGGTNVAGLIPKRWANYGREQLLRDNPEVFIILIKSPGDFGPAREWLSGQAYLQSLPAIKSGRIYPLDENKTSRYGPRLFDALEELAHVLHPGCFDIKSALKTDSHR